MMRFLLSRYEINRGSLLLVNAAHPLMSAAPTPTLIPISKSVRLAACAAHALRACLQAIGAGNAIVPVSGWRSVREQQYIWDGSMRESGPDFTRQYVAQPGCSEHQTGLAIDLGENREEIDFIRPSFPYHGICQRFRESAASYGFTERYPAGKEAVTGISAEPWHFRYVGVPHACIMRENGLTLEEYHHELKRCRFGHGHLKFRHMGVDYEIFYAEAAELALPSGVQVSVSGNNEDGFIVTLVRQSSYA